MKKIFCCLAVLLGIITFSFPNSATALEKLHINIYGPGQSRLNLYLSPPKLSKGSKGSPQSSQIQDAMQSLNTLLDENFSFLPFMSRVSSEQILGKEEVKGYKAEEIDFHRLKLSKLDLLVTASWNPQKGDFAQVELRTFNVFNGRLLLGRGYLLSSTENILEVADRYSAHLMEKLTGRSGFFKSELAFVKKQGKKKNIFICTPQGRKIKQISDLSGICLSPVWSWDGSKIAFTYVGKEKHELVVWDREAKDLQRLFLPGNTIISPAFKPDGTLTISADPKGNPDIFELSPDYRLKDRLIDSWAIDISQQFDARGQKMVFVSSRLGNPHIFLKNFQNNELQRLSFEGTYNTNPAISPNGRFVAYSRLLPQGHRIVVLDLETGEERLVTSGPGNDEDPAWGPDSYFLAFASSRGGEYKIYLTTRHGEEIREVPTGQGPATSPAWNCLH